jgi:hypothetical protein
LPLETTLKLKRTLNTDTELTDLTSIFDTDLHTTLDLTTETSEQNTDTILNMTEMAESGFMTMEQNTDLNIGSMELKETKNGKILAGEVYNV